MQINDLFKTLNYVLNEDIIKDYNFITQVGTGKLKEMHGGAGSDYIDSIEISGIDIKTKTIKASEVSFPYPIPTLELKNADKPLLNDILIEIKFNKEIDIPIDLRLYLGINNKFYRIKNTENKIRIKIVDFLGSEEEVKFCFICFNKNYFNGLIKYINDFSARYTIQALYDIIKFEYNACYIFFKLPTRNELPDTIIHNLTFPALELYLAEIKIIDNTTYNYIDYYTSKKLYNDENFNINVFLDKTELDKYESSKDNIKLITDNAINKLQIIIEQLTDIKLKSIEIRLNHNYIYKKYVNVSDIIIIPLKQFNLKKKNILEIFINYNKYSFSDNFEVKYHFNIPTFLQKIKSSLKEEEIQEQYIKEPELEEESDLEQPSIYMNIKTDDNISGKILQKPKKKAFFNKLKSIYDHFYSIPEPSLENEQKELTVNTEEILKFNDLYSVLKDKISHFMASNYQDLYIKLKVLTEDKLISSVIKNKHMNFEDIVDFETKKQTYLGTIQEIIEKIKILFENFIKNLIYVNDEFKVKFNDFTNFINELESYLNSKLIFKAELKDYLGKIMPKYTEEILKAHIAKIISSFEDEINKIYFEYEELIKERKDIKANLNKKRINYSLEDLSKKKKRRHLYKSLVNLVGGKKGINSDEDEKQKIICILFILYEKIENLIKEMSKLYNDKYRSLFAKICELINRECDKIFGEIYTTTNIHSINISVYFEQLYEKYEICENLYSEIENYNKTNISVLKLNSDDKYNINDINYYIFKYKIDYDNFKPLMIKDTISENLTTDTRNNLQKFIELYKQMYLLLDKINKKISSLNEQIYNLYIQLWKKYNFLSCFYEYFDFISHNIVFIEEIIYNLIEIDTKSDITDLTYPTNIAYFKIDSLDEFLSKLELDSIFIRTFPRWYKYDNIINQDKINIKCISLDNDDDILEIKLELYKKINDIIEKYDDEPQFYDKIYETEFYYDEKKSIKQILEEGIKIMKEYIYSFKNYVEFFQKYYYIISKLIINKNELTLIDWKYIQIQNLNLDNITSLKQFKFNNFIIDDTKFRKDLELNNYFERLNIWKTNIYWYEAFKTRLYINKLTTVPKHIKTYKYIYDFANILNYDNTTKKLIYKDKISLAETIKFNYYLEIIDNENKIMEYNLEANIQKIIPDLLEKTETTEKTEAPYFIKTINPIYFIVLNQLNITLEKLNKNNWFVLTEYILVNLEQNLLTKFINGLNFIDMILYIFLNNTHFCSYIIKNIKLILSKNNETLVIDEFFEFCTTVCKDIYNFENISSDKEKLNTDQLCLFILETYLYLNQMENIEHTLKFGQILFEFYKYYILYSEDNIYHLDDDLMLYLIATYLDFKIVIYNYNTNNKNVEFYKYYDSVEQKDSKLYLYLYQNYDNIYYQIFNIGSKILKPDNCNPEITAKNYELIYTKLVDLFETSDLLLTKYPKMFKALTNADLNKISEIPNDVKIEDLTYLSDLTNLEIHKLMLKVLKHLKISYILIYDNAESLADFYKIISKHLFRCIADYKDETLDKCKKYFAYMLLIKDNVNVLLKNLLNLNIFDLIRMNFMFDKDNLIIDKKHKQAELFNEIDLYPIKTQEIILKNHSILEDINQLIGNNYTKDIIDGDYRGIIEEYFRTDEGELEIKMSNYLQKFKLVKEDKEEFKYNIHELKIQLATELLFQSIFKYDREIKFFKQLEEYYDDNIFAIYTSLEIDLDENLKTALIMAEFNQILKIANISKIYFMGDNIFEDYKAIRLICFETYELKHKNINAQISNSNFYDLASNLLLNLHK